MGVYWQGGFCITEIRADNKFFPLVSTFAEKIPHVNFNFVNPNKRVPEAEKNNRVIKERIRPHYHCLPLQQLSRLMVQALTIDSSKELNFLPACYGVSKCYSPCMIMHKKSLQYNDHGKYAIGTYMMGHEEPTITNTNVPRTIDCIYLQYNVSHQGGHELLHLATGKLVIHHHVTPIPITPSVILQVHALAEKEKIPAGLKIKNHLGTMLYDSAWIAWVDYDADEFEDKDIGDKNYINHESDKDPEEENLTKIDDTEEIDPNHNENPELHNNTHLKAED